MTSLENRDPRRCAACLMLQRLCICALIPKIDCATRLVLIIHRREIRKPTNSGALAARCLSGSEVYVRGAPDAPIDYARVAPPEATNLLLFPGEGAAVLDQAFVASLARPVRLLVPDGNWGQAAKVGRKFPADAPVTRVTLPDGEPSRYVLRREAPDRPEGLATLEAIARAFAILEGPAVSTPLLEIFRIMVDRTLWSRGALAAEAVYGGLPP